MPYNPEWLIEDRAELWKEGDWSKLGMQRKLCYMGVAVGTDVGRRASNLFAAEGVREGGREAVAKAKAAKAPLPAREGDHMLRTMDAAILIRRPPSAAAARGKKRKAAAEVIKVAATNIRDELKISAGHVLTREEAKTSGVECIILCFLTSKTTSGLGVYSAKDEIMIDDDTPESSLLKEDLLLYLVNTRPENAVRVPADDEGFLGYYNREKGAYNAPNRKHVVTMMKARGLEHGVPAQCITLKSFRVGLVTELERAGASAESINVSGGWAAKSRVAGNVYSRNRPLGVLALKGRTPLTEVERAAVLPAALPPSRKRAAAEEGDATEERSRNTRAHPATKKARQK